MRPALIVLNPQNDFFGEDNPNLGEFRRAVPAINAAVALFRERNWPILFVQHTSAGRKQGSYEWGIFKEFDYRPDDISLSKTLRNAFACTGLDLVLNSHDVELIVVCGFLSEHCVLATYRKALERDYQAAILKDGIASLDNEATQMVLQTCTRTSLELLQAYTERVTNRRWQNAGTEREGSTHAGASDYYFAVPDHGGGAYQG